MGNKVKYNALFIETLGVEDAELKDLKYQGTALWDSVGHMALISAIENAFDIMMDTDDIIDLSSYEKGLQILKEKYGIDL